MVKQNNDIEQVMHFLEECKFIKIEDILPFFPDFVTIDHFKDAVCSSLEVRTHIIIIIHTNVLLYYYEKKIIFFFRNITKTYKILKKKWKMLQNQLKWLDRKFCHLEMATCWSNHLIRVAAAKNNWWPKRFMHFLVRIIFIRNVLLKKCNHTLIPGWWIQLKIYKYVNDETGYSVVDFFSEQSLLLESAEYIIPK